MVYIDFINKRKLIFKVNLHTYTYMHSSIYINICTLISFSYANQCYLKQAHICTYHTPCAW